MCGIYGYIGDDKSAPARVLTNLRKLEYRGYDSWGIGAASNGKIVIDKHIGKIGEAKTILENSNLVIGHTRWATHGGVVNENAHPHVSCAQDIAIVHNGIIENYQEIRAGFKNQHKIISGTDSEIFAHLVEEYLVKFEFGEAVRLAFATLRGLSAFVVVSAGSSEIVAIKNGSPLVIGLGEGENYIASDANCLLDQTKRAIYLEDNEMAILTKTRVRILNAKTGQEITPKITLVDWEASAATKEEYPHFMAKEINEQPRVLEHIYLNFDEHIKKFARLISAHKKIYLVGCGSAHYAAILGSYLLAKVAGVESSAIPGSEFTYKESFIDKQSLVIFFSQSGETIDVVEPLKRMKQKGVTTLAVVNVFGSSLYRMADEKIWLEAGPEICVLTTKAFTAMAAVMQLVAYQIKGNLAEGKRLLQQSIKDLTKVLQPEYQRKYIEPVVRILARNRDVFGIGKGLSYPLILETALKVKEVSYIHMEGFPSGELKHGVIALVDKGTPCIVLAPDDETYGAVISGATEIKARGGYLIALSGRENPIFDSFIPVPDRGVFTGLTQVVVAQLIAYRLAILKELDPDKPRNLAKSVTVV